MHRGVAVISIDTELAWGQAHRRDEPAHDYGGERAVIDRLLEILERYDLAATWAIVGHLFLDRCSPVDGRPHPEIVRPGFDWLDGDWFDVDPCTDADRAPTHYAPDIVDRILACPVPQEIGCHSFAHVMAGEPGCSVEAFRSDLAACAAAAGAKRVTLRSFVFPRNSLGHLDELVAAGYTTYRGRPAPPFADRPALVRRLLRVADRVRPLAGSAVQPEPNAPLWNVPQTFLFAPATHLRRVPIAAWVRLPIARLRQAARQRSLFHLWFHPYNITAGPERALAGFDLVCREAARLRSRADLDVMTMGELAERLAQLA
jgi:peptidoglycan/xylan/chitin deacetylase (PgdA/CDA1 family)